MKRTRRYNGLLSSVIAVVLTIIAFVQPFQKNLITFAYHLNKSYIAENLCENQLTPALHCEGTCQLKKKIKEANEREQQETIAQLSLEIQFMSPTTPLSLPLDYVELPVTIPVFVESKVGDSYLSDIFRPPLPAAV